jgi:preprotein translocase subunit SecA
MNMLFQLGHSPIFCYVAMDDPFFEVFGGERMKELMLKMGMKEEERMEHPMIDRSIERGMQQLSSGKYIVEITDTEAEWYARRQAR